MDHASQLVRACETVWEALQAEHPDVPDVVLVVGPDNGKKGKGFTKHGHFWAGRWTVGTGTKDGDPTPEVLLVGEALRRPAAEVFGTIVHEAAHGVAFTRKVKDTDVTGKRHNKRFKAIAEELGLAVETPGHPSRGFAFTSVPDELLSKYDGVLAELGEALRLYRNATVPAAAKTSRNQSAAICGCGRKIRVSESTLEEGEISCSLCDTPFEVER